MENETSSNSCWLYDKNMSAVSHDICISLRCNIFTQLMPAFFDISYLCYVYISKSHSTSDISIVKHLSDSEIITQT